VQAGGDAVGLICAVTHVTEDALAPDQARRLARPTPDGGVEEANADKVLEPCLGVRRGHAAPAIQPAISVHMWHPVSTHWWNSQLMDQHALA
jgi:hypothetical protein